MQMAEMGVVYFAVKSRENCVLNTKTKFQWMECIVTQYSLFMFYSSILVPQGIHILHYISRVCSLLRPRTAILS